MPLPDNEHINIELVIAVEDYPVLYNQNLKEYSNRNHQDNAWRLVAQKLQATEAECKQRWRNIRNALTRYIRLKNTTGSAPKKTYYLWDHLQYLLPFTKSRPQSGNLGVCSSSQQQATATDSKVNDPKCLEGEADGEDFGNAEQGLSTNNDAPSPLTWASSTPSSYLASWRSSKIREKKVDPLEKVMVNYFERKEKKQSDSNATADLNFLTSLLPDMTSLPPKKKRFFKRKVLDLLDELAEDGFSADSSRATVSTTPTPPSPTWNPKQK